MSNADFDTRNTSPGTRPTTAKPAENGRKHPSIGRPISSTPGNRPAGHAQHHHPPPPATAQNPRNYGRFTVSSARPAGPFKRAAPQAPGCGSSEVRQNPRSCGRSGGQRARLPRVLTGLEPRLSPDAGVTARPPAGSDSLLRRPQRPTATRKSSDYGRLSRFRPGRPGHSRRAAPQAPARGFAERQSCSRSRASGCFPSDQSTRLIPTTFDGGPGRPLGRVSGRLPRPHRPTS